MTNIDQQLTDPSRIKSFARFFKNYMSISTVVTAALPIPVTLAGFIPTYTAQTKMLSVYTTLFCFLLLSFTFYNRHPLARWMFRRHLNSRLGVEESHHGVGTKIVRWLPLILMLLCLVTVFTYHAVLRESVVTKERVIFDLAAAEAIREIGETESEVGYKEILDSLKANAAQFSASLERDRDKYDTYSDYILNSTDLAHIKYDWQLMGLYLLVFIFAEGAFVLMALKEYLQDLLGVSDLQLLGIDD